MAQVFSRQPSTIEELKDRVETFALHIDSATIRSMARHTRYRVKLCVNQGGGHFEHLVKKYRARKE